jgi:CDP-diglyceride synthetase
LDDKISAVIPGFQWVGIIVAFVFAWLWSRRADGSRKHCELYYVAIIGVLVTGFTARMMLPEQTSEKLVVLLLVGCLAIQFIDQWVMENRTHRSAQWKLAGRCEKCGYDVRATAGRCPECGMPVPATQPRQNPADPPK